MDYTDAGPDGLVKVIDYKSGSTEFKKELVEEGLQLQLMLYLESAAGTEKNGHLPKPAGVFYYHIARPQTQGKLEDLQLEKLTAEMAEAAEKQICDKYNLGAADFNAWNTAVYELAVAKYNLSEARCTLLMKYEILKIYADR